MRISIVSTLTPNFDAFDVDAWRKLWPWKTLVSTPDNLKTLTNQRLKVCEHTAL